MCGGCRRNGPYHVEGIMYYNVVYLQYFESDLRLNIENRNKELVNEDSICVCFVEICLSLLL